MISKSKIFFSSCLSFILGIGARSFLNISLLQNCLVFLITLLIPVFFPNKMRHLAAGAIFFSLGILICNLQLPKAAPDKIYSYNGQKVVFQALIAKEPEIKISQQRLIVKSEKIFLGQKWKKVSGNVLVAAKLYPQYNYGDQLQIDCKLKPPQKIENFDYPSYLFAKKIYSLCDYSKIKIMASDKGNIVLTAIFELKNKLQEIINYSLPEPQASLFSALTLGNRSALPYELTEKFQKAGISHIIAVSGSHITIIGLILSNLFVLLYLPKKYAFYLSSFFLFLFVILTGAQSSVVRAGIMGFLVLLAEKEGRLKNSLNALVFSAALMLLFNPWLLRYEVGFQLSFLAVLGMIYFYPFLNNLNFLKKTSDFLKLKTIFLITVSAQLATLPLVIYYFHYYPIASVLSNLLILPILPLIMIGGLLFLFGGLICLPLAKILFVLIYPFLVYIIKISETFNL